MKRGRPREVCDPVRLDIRLASLDYDALDRLARQRAISIPALLRQIISAVINRRGAESRHTQS